MPIYTRTGDKGKTSLLNGERVPKYHTRVDAYGTIDELNSNLGAAIAFLPSSKDQSIKKELEKIQSDLFEIGSALALPLSKEITGLDKRPTDFEKIIDDLTNQMPPLKNFILPGGSKPGALLHISRTIARKAERKIVALAHKEEIDTNIVTYINRLSDLLFTIARFINIQSKQKETLWSKTKNS